jgi:hypothetical protein
LKWMVGYGDRTGYFVSSIEITSHRMLAARRKKAARLSKKVVSKRRT